MLGYAQRQLDAGLLEAHALASALVAGIPSHLDSLGREIRCHEFARAVARELDRRAGPGVPNVHVIDGCLGIINHSWLLLTLTTGKGAILDVYTPGRLPQVQLLDLHPAVTEHYRRISALPDDTVRHGVVDELCCMMQDNVSSW